MKAQLIFDLIDLDDRLKHQRAILADDMMSVIWDMDQWLRSEIKYNEKPYQEVRDFLHEMLRDEGINLDKLWS
jgi:hypothetical protein